MSADSNLRTEVFHFYCRIVLESEELSNLLWKRIQPYLTDFDIPEDTPLSDLHIHGVPYLLRGRWQPIGLNKVTINK